MDDLRFGIEIEQKELETRVSRNYKLGHKLLWEIREGAKRSGDQAVHNEIYFTRNALAALMEMTITLIGENARLQKRVIKLESGSGVESIEHDHDGERRGCFRFTVAGKEHALPYRHEAVIDRGVFMENTFYEKGDGVTFGNSRDDVGGGWWIAQKDDPKGRPGQSDDWRLAARAGRDGRDRTGRA